MEWSGVGKEVGDLERKRSKLVFVKTRVGISWLGLGRVGVCCKRCFYARDDGFDFVLLVFKKPREA
jgi:hypothetical protein